MSLNPCVEHMGCKPHPQVYAQYGVTARLKATCQSERRTAERPSRGLAVVDDYFFEAGFVLEEVGGGEGDGGFDGEFPEASAVVADGEGFGEAEGWAEGLFDLAFDAVEAAGGVAGCGGQGEEEQQKEKGGP